MNNETPTQPSAAAAAAETVAELTPGFKRRRAGRKPNGEAGSEMTRLKIRWDQLPEDDQDYWRDLFASDLSLEKIRELIREKLNINLRFDNQVARFRTHVEKQDERADEMARAAAEVKDFQAMNPDLTVEEIRTEIFRRAYLRVLGLGDFTLGLNVMRAHTRLEQHQLDREKHDLQRHGHLM